MLLDNWSAPDWHSDAACIGKWELFDHEVSNNDRITNACRTICFNQCEVRHACLHDVMKSEIPDLHSNGKDYGRATFRGGYTPAERRTILGTKNPKDWTWDDTIQF